MNNIKEEQKEEQCQGVGTMSMKSRRRNAIEKQQ
jgi:hypothetical protein